LPRLSHYARGAQEDILSGGDISMSSVLPFRVVRPARKFVSQVAALPYDVMTREEARQAVIGNQQSFLHVEKSEIDVPDEIKSGNPLIYQTARNNFAEMLSKGIFLHDENPYYYVYRQQMGRQIQTGIVGTVSAKEYDNGKIKKHELTRKDKEEDRICHIDTVNAQTGPVFITYHSRPRLDEIVTGIIKGDPEYNFTADDGIRHTVWVVNDFQQCDEIKNEFAKIDALYIADGHHRAAAAAAVARKRREKKDNNRNNQEYEYILAVLFPHNQLYVMDYNRAVKDLYGLTPHQLMEKIKANFIVSENFMEKSPQKFHDFGMYFQGKWYRLTIKEGKFDNSNPVARLDAAILQEHILSPILGINDPRVDERIKFIGGIRGMAELEKLVDKDGFAVAFSLYPTTIEQVMQVADAGAIMPPKSTWFEPKLRSGIFIHEI
jgi:uncharacterized protein (DUF1015 family)